VEFKKGLHGLEDELQGAVTLRPEKSPETLRTPLRVGTPAPVADNLEKR
jgi:hypothetical protein